MAGEVIFAKLSQLEAFGTKVVTDFAALTARVQSLERAGGQPNIIEKILVNGIQLAVDGNKAVNFSVPTKTGELENDAGFQNGTQVDEKLSTKADSGHDHDGRYFTKEQVNSAIAGKADTSHTHDDRYYTESEMDANITPKAKWTTSFLTWQRRHGTASAASRLLLRRLTIPMTTGIIRKQRSMRSLREWRRADITTTTGTTPRARWMQS